jgi:hypothetical protein
MESVETVKVIRKDHPDGAVVINKEDMKPDDKVYVEPKKAPPKKAAK